MREFATITVIGRDKTGVIARVTNFLFEQHANIEALEEQVTRGQFSMTLQASWKRAELNPDQLRAGLDDLSRQLGIGRDNGARSDDTTVHAPARREDGQTETSSNGRRGARTHKAPS